jgi:dihydroorotase-like cyclic amidohydrolase
MMHASAKTGVDAIAAARAKGVPIYGETLQQYLMYTAEFYLRGQLFRRSGAPPAADGEPENSRNQSVWSI